MTQLMQKPQAMSHMNTFHGRELKNSFDAGARGADHRTDPNSA
jgi:hypothetical protein